MSTVIWCDAFAAAALATDQPFLYNGEEWRATVTGCHTMPPRGADTTVHHDARRVRVYLSSSATAHLQAAGEYDVTVFGLTLQLKDRP